MKSKYVILFAVSFLVLFLESSLIRWIPSQVRALAYFKNLVLISSFLGLGLGLILRKKASWLTVALPIFFLLEIGVALLLGQALVVGSAQQGEYLWLLYFDLPPTAPIFPLALAIPIFYVLNTFTFIPLGQMMAVAMDDVGDSILAYIINICGSLVGVLAFVVVSFLERGPDFWFVPSLLLYGLLCYQKPRVLTSTAVVLVVLLLLPIEHPGTLWSPYYSLRVTPSTLDLQGDSYAKSSQTNIEFVRSDVGYDISVNGSFHQGLVDFDEPVRAEYPHIEQLYQDFQTPYRYYQEKHGRMPKRVLIIGAGTGNDVGIALRQGVEHIDAVEIDPVILRLGQQLHPDQVYSDPRVKYYVDDARSYLRSTNERYDLIVFGTLDSQTALSAMSTIRLDNYIYTRESLQQAKALLEPDGVLALYFAAYEWIANRLVLIVEQAFGHTPELFPSQSDLLFSMVAVVPNQAAPISAESQKWIETVRASDPRPLIPTDDWPYLYLQERTISRFYLAEILVLVIISFIFLRITLWPRFGVVTTQRAKFHFPLFLQGVGFMFLETRSLSIMPLLFGTTWIVSAIVISAVLLVILLANLTVRNRQIQDIRLPFVGLTLTLLLGYFFPISILLDQNLLVRLVVSTLVYLSPVFFSSLIFGVFFARAEDIGWAYGSNLFGSVIGGFGEYIAAVTGLRALSLVALAIFIPILLIERYGWNLPSWLLVQPTALEHDPKAEI